jgi:hypothetical protein
MVAKSSTKKLMTKMGRVFLCGMMAILAAASSAADIGGQWRAEFDTQIGLQKYVFTFQADGSKVTGKAVSEVNGQKREAELKEGTLSDDSLSFVEMFSFQGNDIRIKYTGKIGTDGIAFTREVGDFAKEQFKATRVASASPATGVWHVDGNGHDPTHWKNNLWLFAQHIFK